MTSLNAWNAIEAISKIDAVDEDAKVTETDKNLQYWLFTYHSIDT